VVSFQFPGKQTLRLNRSTANLSTSTVLLFRIALETPEGPAVDRVVRIVGAYQDPPLDLATHSTKGGSILNSDPLLIS
jgi:hypothetical protein